MNNRQVAGPPRIIWLDLLAVFLLALAVRTVNIGHTSFYDEFYHVLAAKSWLDNGTLQIGEGVYTRAPGFTILIAWVFKVFGESLVAARMVSVMAGSLLVALVYLWTAVVSNRTAAWIASLLLCFSPVDIFLSQIVRFYAIHSLLFWIGAVGVYAAVTRSDWRLARIAVGAGAILLFAIDYELQPTTLIGVAGLGLWVLLEFLRWFWSRHRFTTKQAILIAILLLTAVLVGLFIAQSGLIDGLINKYRGVPLWASGSQDNIIYYHRWFLRNYTALWALLPVAVLVACYSAVRPAVFCTVVFATAVVFHSFGGTKGGRYIAYALPFVFIIWGIAIARFLPWLSDLIEKTEAAVFGRVRGVLVSRILKVSAFLAFFAFLLASGRAFPLSYKMLTLADNQWPKGLPSYRGNADWELAAPLLKQISNESSVLVTSAGIKALYHLDRYDVEISATQQAEAGSEFTIDGRTGRRIISVVDSVQSVYDCYPTGLVVIEDRHWRNPWAVNGSVADLLEAVTEPLELPPDTRLMAFTWNHPDLAVTVDCSTVLSRDHDASD